MKTVKMLTSKLSGAPLDYAVMIGVHPGNVGKVDFFNWMRNAHAHHRRFYYSTEWDHGGEIIEREEIGTKRNAPCSKGREWEASPSITARGAGGKYGYGPTLLIAAMRCYVASKFGDEVDIPEGIE